MKDLALLADTEVFTGPVSTQDGLLKRCALKEAADFCAKLQQKRIQARSDAIKRLKGLLSQIQPSHPTAE